MLLLGVTYTNNKMYEQLQCTEDHQSSLKNIYVVSTKVETSLPYLRETCQTRVRSNPEVDTV